MTIALLISTLSLEEITQIHAAYLNRKFEFFAKTNKLKIFIRPMSTINKKAEQTQELKLTVGEIRKAIPENLFKKDEFRFLINVAYSLSLTLVLIYLARLYIPFTWSMLPIWILFALFTGTVEFGLWILGHECGHGSFSNIAILNDILGFLLHTPLIVPYFSWQHSHAIHHAKTNHLTQGESHCPQVATSRMGKFYLKVREIVGPESFSIIQMINFFFLGFPCYLLFGSSGGPSRGFTSHFFVPNQLFPQHLLLKVHISNLGIIGWFYLLYLWAQATSFAEVSALWIGPYLVVNAWLTFVTFLQHTDIDVPHYDEVGWTWLKETTLPGLTPFIGTLERLTFSIIFFLIYLTFMPKYKNRIQFDHQEANIYLKQTLGSLYNGDSKNLFMQIYQTAKLAAVEPKGNGVYKYI